MSLTKQKLITSCKASIFCPVLIKFGASGQISIKVRDVKFHGIPSSRSRANAADGRTDIMKLIGAFGDDVDVQ